MNSIELHYISDIIGQEFTIYVDYFYNPTNEDEFELEVQSIFPPLEDEGDDVRIEVEEAIDKGSDFWDDMRQKCIEDFEGV
tara:strand:+ start:257 stop:499 length:243 start_codon:yes stop_codon:yes gene_type:complete